MDDPTATNPAGWFARTYQYSATIPHAVTSVTPETGSPDTYSYDANGNMTCRIENGVTYTHTYNAENRASSIAKRSGDCVTGTVLESWSFVYDGDGTRVMTAHFTGSSGTPDSTTSYFMGGAYEVKDTAVKKYYSIAGMMVAVNDGTGLQYLLTDHLGSTVAVTNSTGTLTSEQRYLPFGGARSIPNSPITGTDFTYTGQRKLDDGMGGIMDYKARFYSPYINRFLQPDSIIPDPANPQAFNRFAYVNNRPINFNDPSGHIPCFGDNFDDGPQCVKKNPGAYNPTTLEDFENMTWRNRQAWLASFAQRNRLDKWFDDMGYAIEYMMSDPSLATEGSTAEVMDAAVLQAINDGWLMFNGEDPFGDGGQSWAIFFDALINKTVRDINKLIIIRLEAEQYGVDYAWELGSTQSAYNNSSQLDQIYFNIFKWGADNYRSNAAEFRSNPLAVDYAGFILIQSTDPRTSGPYLNFAGQFGYPAAVVIWSYANSFPPSPRMP